jgi:hypothetical protein
MNSDGARARGHEGAKNNGDSGGAVDQERGGRKNVVGGKARRSGGTTVEQP